MESQKLDLDDKLRSLEDQLEESKEIIDDSNKKNRKLRIENENLQSELDDIQRQNNIYKQNFDEVKQELSELKYQFEKNQEALDFVTEVLTAKIVDDISETRLHHDIDSIVDFIRGELRDILKQTGDISSDVEKKYFEDDLDSWAVTKKKNWIQGKKTIAFIGEFSAGKTTIVNRILSQDNPTVPLLPVSMKATTAIPTYISGGLGTFYCFVTPDDELKMISPTTFARVNKEVLDKVKGVSSLIQYFVMTYKNPYLDKMSILDTPGFSSDDADDEKRTIDVINECDALFWVFDVNAGTLNRTSIQIIKNHLVKPLYVVINQIDTKSKVEVDKVEKLIEKTLTKEGVVYTKIIRFSRKEPLDIIMRAINEVPKDDIRESFFDELAEFVRDQLKNHAEKTKKVHEEYKSIQAEHEKLTKKFRLELGRLDEDCDQLFAIPQENRNILGKNDYRMTKAEFADFERLIKRISRYRRGNLNIFYNDQIENVSELEMAWSKYSEAKKLQTSLQKCLDKLILKGKPHLNRSKAKSNYSNISSKISSTTSITRNDDVERIIDLAYFKRYFGGAILNEIDENLKIRWEGLHSALEYHCGTKFTTKRLKELIPTYGIIWPVNKNELLKQVNDILVMSKSK